MVDAVRKLTGADVTTFQGRYAYHVRGARPFVVGSED
jgi:hypothetical protein